MAERYDKAHARDLLALASEIDDCEYRSQPRSHGTARVQRDASGRLLLVDLKGGDEVKHLFKIPTPRFRNHAHARDWTVGVCHALAALILSSQPQDDELERLTGRAQR